MDELSETGLVRAEAGLPPPRLWRSRSNRVVAGVIGGLAEKFSLAAFPVRLLYGALTFFSGGLLAIPYVALWAITRPHGLPRQEPRLRRASSNKVIGGVLGGFADKWGVSATMLRVLYVPTTLFTMVLPGTMLYLVLWALMPPADEGGGRDEESYYRDHDE